MTDDRFFRRSAPIALGEIAAHVGGELLAPAAASFLVSDIAALDCAKTGELSVYCDGKRTSDFANNHASVVVTNRALSEHAHNGSWLMLVNDPRLAFAQIGHLFYPPIAFPEGVHPSAQISPAARIGAGTQIGSALQALTAAHRRGRRSPGHQAREPLHREAATHGARDCRGREEERTRILDFGVSKVRAPRGQRASRRSRR